MHVCVRACVRACIVGGTCTVSVHESSLVCVCVCVCVCWLLCASVVSSISSCRYVDVDRDHIHSGRRLPHFPRVGFNRLAQLLRRARSDLDLPAHPADIYRANTEDDEDDNDELGAAGGGRYAPSVVVPAGAHLSAEALQVSRVEQMLDGSDTASRLGSAGASAPGAMIGEHHNQSHVIQRLRSLRVDRRSGPANVARMHARTADGWLFASHTRDCCGAVCGRCWLGRVLLRAWASVSILVC